MVQRSQALGANTHKLAERERDEQRRRGATGKRDAWGLLYLHYSCYLVPSFLPPVLNTVATHLDGSVSGGSVLAVALVGPVRLWLDLLDT